MAAALRLTPAWEALYPVCQVIRKLLCLLLVIKLGCDSGGVEVFYLNVPWSSGIFVFWICQVAYSCFGSVKWHIRDLYIVSVKKHIISLDCLCYLFKSRITVGET